MRVAVRRLILLSLLGTSLVVFPACSDLFDAFMVNPCSRSLRVQTFDQRDAEKLLGVSATLPPTSVTKVEDAFSDASGRDWLVVVDGKVELPINGDEWVHDTVVIPANVCR